MRKKKIVIRSLMLVIMLVRFHHASACTASFTFAIAGNTVTFANTSVAPATAGYYWNFGDGSSSSDSSPVHHYIYPSTYYVCLTVDDTANGCSDFYCDSVNLPNACASSYTYIQSGYTFSFTDNSSGSYTQWHWNFGDGTFASIANPIHIFPAVGNYTVCLSVSDSGNACYSTSCQMIYSPIDSNQDCSACFTKQSGIDSVQFFDCSWSANQITSWYWDFGDGVTSTLQNPVHTYPTLGIYTACLMMGDNSGCSSTVCDTVMLVLTNCAAAFTDSSNGSSIQFADQSYAGIHTTNWDFGDGTFSNQNNPSHSYAIDGTYTVCLTIDDSAFCHSTSCKQLSVGGGGVLCYASFSLYPDSFQQGLYHGYNQSSGNNLLYFWSWGDSTTSTGAYPTHQYPDSSAYYICLGIHDTVSGCADSFCTYYMIQKLEHPMGIRKVIFVDPASLVTPIPVAQIQWSMFPNPAANSLCIQTDATRVDEIRIRDVNGKVLKQIFSYSGKAISLEALHPGVFLVQVLIDGAWRSKLLIKQ